MPGDTIFHRVQPGIHTAYQQNLTLRHQLASLRHQQQQLMMMKRRKRHKRTRIGRMVRKYNSGQVSQIVVLRKTLELDTASSSSETKGYTPLELDDYAGYARWTAIYRSFKPVKTTVKWLPYDLDAWDGSTATDGHHGIVMVCETSHNTANFSQVTSLTEAMTSAGRQLRPDRPWSLTVLHPKRGTNDQEHAWGDTTDDIARDFSRFRYFVYGHTNSATTKSLGMFVFTTVFAFRGLKKYT